MVAKKSRILLLGLLVSLLTIGICDAKPRKKKVKVPKRSEYVSLQRIKELNFEPNDIFLNYKHASTSDATGLVIPTSALYQRYGKMRDFDRPDYLDWYAKTIETITDNYVVINVEHFIIATGETTRVKYYFDNKFTERVVVEGIGETTPEDIAKGEFVVNFTPEETCILKATIYTKDADGNKFTVNGDRRIIVVPTSQLNEVMEKQSLVNSNDKTPNKALYHGYLAKLAGVVPDPTLGKPTHNEEMVKLYVNNSPAPDIKTLLAEDTKIFEEYKLPEGVDWSTMIEHVAIVRGDSTRLKIMFKPRTLTQLEIKGVGKASKEDLKKGEFVVTVKPNKSKEYLYLARNVKGFVMPGSFRVVVAEPDEYEKIMGKLYKFKKMRGRKLYNLYIRQLLGQAPKGYLTD